MSQPEETRQWVFKPFLEHLEDLRRAILWGLAAVGLGMAIAAPLAPRIMKILRAPLTKVVPDADRYLRTFEVTGALSIAMQVVFWSGLLLAAPFVLWSLAWFVFPGLTRGERRAVLQGIGFAAILFAVGVVIGYFYAIPAGLTVMLWFNQWMGIPVEFFQVSDYVGFTLKMLLAFGLTFELPVVLLILGRVGIITSRQLRTYRRHAIVIVMIIAMVITPTTDPFSQLMLAIPLILLYELCIWLVWAKERKTGRDRAASAGGPGDRG